MNEMRTAAQTTPAYHPPYPPRPRRGLAPLPLLLTARRNLIAIWPDEAFEWDTFTHRLLRRLVVVCNDPDAVRQAFVDGHETYQAKSPQQRHALAPLIGDGLFISDGETWKRRRRIVAPLTHISMLDALGPAMTAAAGQRAAAWHQAGDGGEINVLAEMAEMTAQIIAGAVFGRRLGPQAASAFVAAFSEYQALVGQLDVISLLGLPDVIPRLHGRRVLKAATRIHHIVDGLIADIIAAGDPDDTSLVAAMRRAGAEAGEAALDLTALRNEASVLFMAGHETTANTLAWVWFLLSQDAATEARLHEEVDRVLDGRAATHADVAALPFTRAVIEETLRLYPPVPVQARRAGQDGRIGDHEVPAGSLVVLVAWLLHRHRRLWDDPDGFRPDRFLPGGSGIPSRYAYVPFSIGPRVCTGAAFALTEAIICVATLAQHFSLRLRPGWAVTPVCRLSLRPGRELPMRLVRRRGGRPER